MKELPLAEIERLYHRDYYLSDCEGFEDFARSRGTRLPRRLAKCKDLLAPRPGERFVDIGSGRGSEQDDPASYSRS